VAVYRVFPESAELTYLARCFDCGWLVASAVRKAIRVAIVAHMTTNAGHVCYVHIID
jgi:hypothetical protein